jgi:hypothetical protein
LFLEGVVALVDKAQDKLGGGGGVLYRGFQADFLRVQFLIESLPFYCTEKLTGTQFHAVPHPIFIQYNDQ